MRRLLIVIGAVAATLYAAASWWRHNRRAGTRFVNRVVDPWLVRRGIVDASRGEIAMLEHVGRRSGTVRFTPVHPEWVAGGVRIVVPVGTSSEWARNVLAAGHCRLQVGDRVLELDEPILLEPGELEDLPLPLRALYGWLGFRYLRLRRFAEASGTLSVPEPVAERAEAGQAEEVGAPS